jgi:arylformamidase
MIAATTVSDTIIDLTMSITDGMTAYPGEPTAHFEPFTTIASDNVAMATVHLFSQIGTHIDAPAHFVADGHSVDQLNLQHCIGPAAIVRLGHLLPGSRITRETLAAHRSILADNSRIILQTGWYEHAGSGQYFDNWPTFSYDAVEYLVDHQLAFLGLDTPSPGNDTSNITLHQALFRNEIALVECLVNTNLLPDRFELICLPLPLVGLDGSPVRAIARISTHSA